MNKKLLLLLLAALVLVLLSTGCTPAASEQPTTVEGQSAPPPIKSSIYNRNAWESYAATFQIQFTGPVNWIYRLKMRQSPALREYDLHIEGISGAQNPGDIRMVTDGKTTWMIGPGTDNECVQFPNGVGMDPEFLGPEMLVDAPEMDRLLKQVGEEQVSGVAARHYQQKGTVTGPWKDAEIDLWAEKDSKMMVLFTFKGAGDDPFFGTGAGQVSAIYATSELGSDPIAPITGCDIAVPLPESASMFVRLPGLASFDSIANSDEIQNFYRTALPQEEWAENEPPAVAEGVTILSYRRGDEVVEIHIQAGVSGGSKVKILFLN